MKTLSLCTAACCWWLMAAVPATAQPTPGQVNEFAPGDPQGWQEGAPSPNPPEVVPDGGPDGDGDAFLENVSSGSFSAGGKMAMFNEQDEWTGDYLGAGITAIEADLNNLGSTPLSIRLTLQTGFATRANTQSVANLDPGSGWQRFSFSVAPEDLASPVDPETLLADVSRLWMFHNPEPTHPGPPINAVLGVDNITAVGSVAEPLMGDYNGNGQVEQADLDLVLLHWGEPADPPPENWTDDLPTGQIDQEELDGVLLNWGNAANQAAASRVPEPTAAAILLVVLACLRTHRYRFHAGRTDIEAA